jgi:hypothetical protein
MMTQKLVENAEQFKKQFRAAVVRGLPVAGGIESAHERHFMPWKIVRITHEDSTGSMKIAITYDSLLTYMKGTGKVTMAALAYGIVARMSNWAATPVHPFTCVVLPQKKESS